MIDEPFWRGRRVCVTGHTGFKGAWLSLWLQALGAEVSGISDRVPTEPSLYELGRVGDHMAAEVTADVRDRAAIADAVGGARPEVLVHMAAQPLVRPSFADPHETFEVNVIGTVNVLEAARAATGLRVAIVVTSDKCYENTGLVRGYREDDPMGGHDPYSASKGAAELVVSSYRRSFFSDTDTATGTDVPGGTALASARAGNVIGGGDWAPERLISDIVRAAIDGTVLRIRNPAAVRPWQHVINPLSGYLTLARALWDAPDLAGGWNFGPPDQDARPVSSIVETMRERWDGRPAWEGDPGPHPHEAAYLKLDSTRARERLGWRPLVGLDDALASVVDWHQALVAGDDMRAVTLRQLDELAGPAL